MASGIDELLGIKSLTISDAMRRIDDNAYGILIVVEENGKLVGTVSDGDIRRYILSGGGLEECCTIAVNRNPIFARSMEEARTLYNESRYHVYPIVDDENRVIDVYHAKRRFNAGHVQLDVPVVVNAGGRGKRLEPYTDVLPKPLIPIGDKPIIEHIMDRFCGYGCYDFHVILNYKKQMIKAFFAEDGQEYRVCWYDEEKPLGTGGGLSLLKGKLNETFFFTNCDILIQTDYEKILKFHREQKNVITMVGVYKNITIPYGVVDLGDQGQIKSMREKPIVSFMVNTGLYVVEPSVVDELNDNEMIDFPDIIEKLRADGKKVSVYPVSEIDFMDMGQHEELQKMIHRLYDE